MGSAALLDDLARAVITNPKQMSCRLAHPRMSMSALSEWVLLCIVRAAGARRVWAHEQI